MGIRDILLFALAVGAVPFILRHPWMGVIAWVLIGVMNPHRLAFGAASEFPFAHYVAIFTLLGVFVTKDKRQLRMPPEIAWLILFMVWMCLTTALAFDPDHSVVQLLRTMKVLLMTLVGAFLLHTKKHVYALVAVICVSLGFYGVKGGVFTILSGGSYRVWGPADSFIEENNALALALSISVPLIVFFYREAKTRLMRFAMGASALLTSLAILGSHSRGALLALAAMSMFLWGKSKKKLRFGILLVLVAPAMVAFMPDIWSDRMRTISTYEDDGSAMGRIYAWQTALNVANDRITGGGFLMNTPSVLARYSPRPEMVLTAHSIYFQALGEQGWIGLTLYLLILFSTWRGAGGIIMRARGDPQLEWAGSLASLIQVSLAAFLVGGAFLSLTYWDVPYYLVLAVATLRHVVREQQNAQSGALGTAHGSGQGIAPGTPRGVQPSPQS